MDPRVDWRRQTSHGRGELPPARAVTAAARAGCRAIALADRGTGAGLAEATDAALAAGVALWPGVAVTAVDRGAAVELVALGCDTPPLPVTEPPRASLAAAVDAIHAAGGVAVLAGPLGPDGPAVEARLTAAAAAGADGCETAHADQRPEQADTARALAARLGLAAVEGAEWWRPLLARWPAARALLMVGGEVGTGKSTVAARLAALLDAVHWSSDALRESLFPLAEVGAAVKYASHASAAVFRVLALEAERSLRAGRAVVADAVFRRRALQGALATVARACDAPLVAVDCRCAEAEQRARLRRRRPGDEHFSEAGEDILDLHRAEARAAPDAYADLVGSPELAAAAARLVVDTTSGAGAVRLAGARTPLAVWLGTWLAAAARAPQAGN